VFVVVWRKVFATTWHEAPEGEVDGGRARFAVDVRVDGVDLPDIIVFLVERVPDECLVLVVLVNALLEL
jgi:hypothetical protein